MRTVYAAQFSISPRGQAESTFDEVVAAVKAWVTGKYVRTWSTPFEMSDDPFTAHPLDGHAIQSSLEAVPDGALYSLELKHPHDADDAAKWITDCSVARLGSAVECAIAVRLSSDAQVIRPLEFVVGYPGIVRELFRRFDLTVNGWPASEQPETFAASNVTSLVHDNLLNSARTIPTVVISIDPWSEKPLFDPRVVQRQTLGLANVVLLESKWAGFKLTELLAKERSCYNGAVRLYWPGFTTESDPFDHGLYLPGRLHASDSRAFSRTLFYFLSNVAVLRFREGVVISAVRDELESREQKRNDELRKQALHGADAAKLESDLLAAWSENDELNKANRELNEDLQRVKADLEAQRESWKQLQQFNASPEGASAAVSQPRTLEFKTVHAAFLQAKADFTGPLIFLDSADESARKSPFRQPERVYELLEAIFEIASRWRSQGGSLGQRWESAFEQFGFEYTQTISQTSSGRWASEYTFPYDGQSRLFDAHVTIGAKQADKCLSVHIYRDDEKRVIVIGYCGRHLTNTRT